MKALKILIGLLLVASLGLNVWLWQQRGKQLAANGTDRTDAAEVEPSRPENETPKNQSFVDENARELARLRNEVVNFASRRPR